AGPPFIPDIWKTQLNVPMLSILADHRGVRAAAVHQRSARNRTLSRPEPRSRFSNPHQTLRYSWAATLPPAR
ncbi:MAG: hypothetical protein OXC09_08555, partial [Truepera sp.]|nr:hypothetical protein [Truepera sp.]